MTSPARRAAVGVALAMTLVVSCSGSQGRQPDLTVFGASSLTDAFDAIGERLRHHRDLDVRFNFLGSSELAAQLEHGAAADVFASADEATMGRVIDAGLVRGEPRLFALNELAIVVAPGNPEGIEGLTDLVDEELVVSLCDPQVPAGAYARRALHRAGVDVRPDSLEPEVRSVLTRVATGEADAGIAYATDVLAAGGRVSGVPIPARHDVLARYPIAALRGASPAADDFIRFVLSEEGGAILASHGFVVPEGPGARASKR